MSTPADNDLITRCWCDDLIRRIMAGERGRFTGGRDKLRREDDWDEEPMGNVAVRVVGAGPLVDCGGGS